MGYNARSVDEAVADLRKCLQRCIERGYLPESAYVSQIIEQIRQERRELREPDIDGATTVVRRQLADARGMQDGLEVAWRNRLALLDAEEQIAVEDLRVRWGDAREQLEREWNTERAKARFNKPSPKLIELRWTAKKLMTVRKFDAAAALAGEIERLERDEAEEALRKMNLAFAVAAERVNQRFANDLETLRSLFITKRNLVERNRDVTMRPVARQVNKYQKRDSLLAEKRRQASVRSRSASANVAEPLPADLTINAKGAKLRLPDVSRAPRGTMLLARPASSMGRSGSSSVTGRCSRLGSLASSGDSLM
jgi:hypothetical protein